MSNYERCFMETPVELLGLPTQQRIEDMSRACDSAGLPEAGMALKGFYDLLMDKRYVRTRADYNRGHLSYCNQLEAREKIAFSRKK